MLIERLLTICFVVSISEVDLEKFFESSQEIPSESLRFQPGFVATKGSYLDFQLALKRRVCENKQRINLMAASHEVESEEHQQWQPNVMYFGDHMLGDVQATVKYARDDFFLSFFVCQCLEDRVVKVPQL